jgi:K+ transporter
MTDPYSPQPQENPPGQPMPYGQSYPMAPQEHPQGTTVLVLGIVGIFFGIAAPFAWYLGNKAQKEIRASGQSYSNEQNINIGRILGMVFTIIYILTIVVSIIFVIIVTTAAMSSR